MDFINFLLNDPRFWVAVSTVLCFGFIGIKAYKPILAGLDGRAEAIRVRLAEADELRAEAEKVLAEYKEKSANAMNEAKQVLENAQRRAEQMRETMEQELNESIARQEASAKARLARMENETIEAVKNTIINAALKRVQADVAKEDEKSTASLAHSLDQITKTLH